MKRLLKLMAISLVSILCMTFAGSILNGCNNEKNNDGDNFIELVDWRNPIISYNIIHNIIIVRHDDEAIICKLVSDFCCFSTFSAEYPKFHREVKVKVNDNVVWEPYPEDSNDKIYKDFVTITLIKDDSVIGYALIKIDFTKEDKNSQVVILVQKLLDEPITETEVQELVNTVKDSNKD
ncbi:MAG: hypothetical protein IJZ73_00320 [Clostridia bacterium]|nr:hypothetical protein [Clostridia bacterium]